MRNAIFEKGFFDRSLPGTLMDRLAESIRERIRSGELRPGDALPSLNELAGLSGVSLIVSRRAVAMLVREGLLVSHRGAPAEVRERGRKPWRGHVACICGGGEAGSAASNMMVDVLRRAFAEAGYLFTRISIPFSGSGRSLYSALADDFRRKFDLVLTSDGTDEFQAVLEKWHVPHVYLTCARPARPSPLFVAGCVKSVDWRPFRELCRRRKIRKILWAHVTPFGNLKGAAEELRQVGARVEELTEPAPRVFNAASRFELDFHRLFCRRFAAGRSSDLPDLILLDDDYIARGALLALAQNGIRLPDDVAVVSFVNRGQEFAAPCTLTRFVNDCRRQGALAAKAALAYLENRRVSSAEIVVPITFELGRTFR